MAYGKDGSGRHLLYLMVLLFGGKIEMFLCAWLALGTSLQRQWWVQRAPFRQKGGLLLWKHQTCRDAVGHCSCGHRKICGSCRSLCIKDAIVHCQ